MAIDVIEFLTRCEKRFGNRHQYDLSGYKHMESKIKVTCKKHGESFQVARTHLESPTGCKGCSRDKLADERKSDTETFIQKARKVHGDRYDYSLVEYQRASIHVTIICPEHGAFKQRPNGHLKGAGCLKCFHTVIGTWNKSNTETFIQKARKVHGDRYDYSLVEYELDNKKVDIICKKHGVFSQSPNPHLQGQGCPNCKSSIGESVLAELFKKYNIEFIREYVIPNSNTRYRYDFFLTQHNTLVEFHGVQHYIPTNWFGGSEGFARQLMVDQTKETLAKVFKMRLIVVSYKNLSLEQSKFEKLVIDKIKKGAGKWMTKF